jgi:hypothetical protein
MMRTNLEFLYVFEKDTIDPEKLILSLQHVLHYYPTIAGRIAPCGTKISLCNTGAAFTVSHVQERVQDLPPEPPIGLPYYHIPSPEKQIKGQEPLLTVALTKFQGGDGSTLGVVISHLIADGHTFAMFVKDWSDIHNGITIEPVEYLLPFQATQACGNRQEANEAASSLGQKRSSYVKRKLFQLLFYTILPKLMASDVRSTTPQVDRLVLHFTDEEVKQIKALANRRSSTWISTNEAMLAHVWRLLLDAADIDESQRQY